LTRGRLTIIIVVTHLGEGARRVDGFFGYVDFFLLGRLEESRSLVNGGLVDTNFFAVGGLEARWVVGGSLVDVDFLAVCGLVLGSVLTLGDVNLSIVLTATVGNLDFDFFAVTVEVR